ncbi:MAG: hypothetical protein AB1568_17065 [Thermodesulfobacteriota bacterium]
MKWKLLACTAALAVLVNGVLAGGSFAADCEVTAVSGDQVTVKCEPAEIAKLTVGKKVKVSK